MKADTNIQNLVSKVLTKVSAFIFDNPGPFNSIDDMLNRNSDIGHISVEPFLHGGQSAVSWFFERLDKVNVFRAEPLETSILEQMDFVGKLHHIFIGNLFIVHCPLMCRAYIDHELGFSRDKIVLYRMGFFFHYKTPALRPGLPDGQRAARSHPENTSPHQVFQGLRPPFAHLFAEASQILEGAFKQ